MIRLVVGGARSGKSSFAEKLFQAREDVVYLATARVEDGEMRERVTHHQKSRPKEWRTFEENYNLFRAVENEKYYLLDCLTVLTSNIMYDKTKELERIDQKTQQQVEDEVVGQLVKLMEAVISKQGELTMVTNEVGYSLVPEHHIGRVFRDIQGRINQKAAEMADEVYLVCCGIPVRIK